MEGLTTVNNEQIQGTHWNYSTQLVLLLYIFYYNQCQVRINLCWYNSKDIVNHSVQKLRIINI